MQHADIDHTGLTGVGGAAFVGVRAFAGAATSLTNNAWTVIALNSESFDTDGFHDLVTNNSRLTVPSGKAGKYAIGAQGGVSGNTTGQRSVRILLNGATMISAPMSNALSTASFGWRMDATTIYDLAVGDYVEMGIFQNSGGAINSQNDGSATCVLWMYRLG